METSYLKAHPFGNRYLEWTGLEPLRSGIPRPLKAQAVLLYHGDKS